MFATGLWLDGRIFPFEFAEPLVALAALADIGIGVPLVAGRVRSASGRRT